MDDNKEIIIRKYKSKRNNVYLIKDNNRLLIQKQYISKTNLETELRCLINLEKEQINIPKVIKTENENIYLEYLDGKSLCDVFEQMEQNKNIEVFNIIKWLITFLLSIYNSEYFKKNNYIINDVNLRNFIFHDNKIYGIDYEEIIIGDIEQDIAGILVFMLTNDPILTTWKINFTKKFYTQMNNDITLNKRTLRKNIEYWIDKIENRRDYDFTKEQRKIIRKIIT